MTNDNEERIVKEALRQTELQIEDLQSSATVHEMRAFQFSSACVLIATLATALGKEAVAPFAVYLASTGLVGAAFWAIFSALPRKFHVRGHSWKDWKGHIEDKDDFKDVLISQAAENDERIKHNFSKLEESAFHFNVSLWIAAISIVIFVLGQLIGIYHRGTGGVV